MLPSDFGDPRVSTNVALHVNVIALLDERDLQFAAELQVDDWNICRCTDVRKGIYKFKWSNSLQLTVYKDPIYQLHNRNANLYDLFRSKIIIQYL